MTFGGTKEAQRCWNDVYLGSGGEKHWGYIPKKKSRNKTILKKFYAGSKLIDIPNICQILPKLQIISSSVNEIAENKLKL